ncbi:uncharacterized protein CANTADRAFT_26672 [Suhomyces tanzawaensis NRRL Y-17324]|uniref:BRCT domain-containing protein n=1 Tax=Suhomyces tanzawaensis NRRL Y-17324 TaxID=984487 RepID=A0A1E4SGM4_9ASCO|nr:uncharacterized protein CANTADRAFT_26672 [Suhomyces tanzawaensis NRRL Y-17324]ODV78663.1 hypothetical protein CANTADRAFT_26672 [Suhomyces tanzawaensis NRRL Y-17324]
MVSSNLLDPPSLDPASNHYDTSRLQDDYNNSLVFASDDHDSQPPSKNTETQPDCSFAMQSPNRSIGDGGPFNETTILETAGVLGQETQRIRPGPNQDSQSTQALLFAPEYNDPPLAADTQPISHQISQRHGPGANRLFIPQDIEDTQKINTQTAPEQEEARGITETKLQHPQTAAELQETQKIASPKPSATQQTQKLDSLQAFPGPGNLEDTQKIHDTQKIQAAVTDDEHTQKIPSQIAVASPISESQSQPQPHENTGFSNFSEAIEDIYRGILDDTQKIIPSYDSESHERVSHVTTSNGRSTGTNPTQVITPGSSQQIDRDQHELQNEVIPFSKPSSIESQGAGYDEPKVAHRQVLNTQEQSDLGLSPKESPEDEFSTGLRSFREGEEVRTDDERMNDDEDMTVLEHQYDDSVFTHKRRKLRANSPLVSSPTKPTLHQFKSFNISSNTSKLSSMVIHPKSDPVVLESASEIVESSPVVKVTDFLQLPPRSSPTKENNVFEEESDGSDMSDINETGIELPKITRRKRKLIIESQSQINSLEKPISNPILRKELLSTLRESSIKNPDSIWGTYNLKVYTGKIVQRGIDQLVVEFSEGLYNINNSDLYLLDIRIGDTIRIRTSTSKFRVTGLSRTDGDLIQCIRGYNYVYIDKQSTKSSAEIGVPLSDCYMEFSDWILHQERYGLVLNISGNSGDEHLPSRRAQRAQTRTQRQRTQPARAVSNPSRSHIEKESLVSTAGPVVLVVKKSLFINQLFCITSIDGERKDQIQALIEENGGTLIDEGLNELFDYTSDSNGQLTLTSDKLDQFTFGCMISNNYCRSAKYLQALALGWPILSDSFIVDCVEGKTSLNEWPVYLLPAGQSKALSSVKSLDVFSFRRNYENEEKLVDQLHNNGHLLRRFNIVVLNNRANGNTLETCKFIFYTLGSKSLKYCAKHEDVFDYLKELNDAGERDILIYDDGGTVSEKLQGMQKPKKERKKGRTRRNGDVATQSDLINFGVIDWEWVVQCVISGYIWNSPIYTIS